MIDEAHEFFYPEFELIFNMTSIHLGKFETTRHTLKGQDFIALDILKLAQADFLVCTFSSNVCRIAYSLRTATKVHFHDFLQKKISFDNKNLKFSQTVF